MPTDANRVVLVNAFSTKMLPRATATVRFSPLSLDEVLFTLALYRRDSKPIESAIGHENTATTLSARLQTEVAFNRTNVLLLSTDLLIVCEVNLPRLQPGELLTDWMISHAEMLFWSVQLAD